MRQSIVKIIGLVSVVVLVGCSSMSGSGSNTAGSQGQGSDAQTYGAGERTGFAGTNGANSQALMDQTIFHFGFDKDIVNNNDVNAIAAHGKYLASHPEAKVTLEGHTDQRGSREYNVGLGERRDQNVEELLMMNGANATQIKLVSYGQEKPVALGQDENAYAQNRRVEIVYQQYS